jgi:Zn-dependent protease
MKWSIRLGKYAGIDVYMHFTFLLLLGCIALIHWQESRSVSAVIAGVGLILTIFLCVILHEYGHALTARRYGVQTQGIVLLPIGGVARLEKIPDNPSHELWVALAGPAVNVVIAISLLVWLKVTATFEPLQALTLTTGPFLERIMAVNMFLVIFNMLPAFPMDGGRVLRAMLALRMEYSRSTQIAAVIGQAVAILFGFVGLFYNPFLLLIAFFVWNGAAHESRTAQLKSAASVIPVQHAMITDSKTPKHDDKLVCAMEMTLSGSKDACPVSNS